MEEIWKSVPRYFGYLEASNLGRIKLLPNNFLNFEKICKGSITRDGFHKVCFKLNGNRYNELAHILVAETFYDVKDYKFFVTHKDKNKLNNNINNLKWIWSTSELEYANSKPIIRFDLNNNIIDEWTNIRSMCKTLNLDRRSVQRNLRGDSKHSSHKGFKFKYKI